jgi:regulator of cell morphogenesis and NO signaling
MSAKLEVHMKKEELILFPMTRRDGHPMIAQIAAMLAVHDDQGVHLRELEALTADYVGRPAGDACPTRCALYVSVKELATT